MTRNTIQKQAPWDRRSALVVKIAAIVALAVHAVILVAYLDRSAAHIPYPFTNDYGEGAVLYQVAAMAAGESIYQPVTQAPYGVSNYPPLFHFLAAMMAKVIGDPLVAGRLLSLLGALASGILIFTLVYGQLHRDYDIGLRRYGAALASLFFLSHYTIIGFSTIMRVDTLALALGLLGMQLFVLSLRRPALTYVYGSAFVLAAYTKPSMVAAALASFGVAFLLRRSRATIAAAFSIIAGLVALLALTAASDGEFIQHVFLYNINQFDLGRLTIRLFQSVFWRWVDIILLLGGLTYLLSRLYAYWRNGAPEKPAPLDTAQLLFAGFMLASLLNVAASGKIGASISYFMEFEAAASLVLGSLAIRLASFMRSDPWGEDCWRRRLLVSLCLVALCWQAIGGYDLKFREPDGSLADYSQRAADLISPADGPVISEEMVLLHRSGQPLFFQPFIMTRLTQAGQWDPEPLVSAVRNGEVSFVVLYSEFGTERYARRFPKEFDLVFRARYHLVEQTGPFRIYAPN